MEEEGVGDGELRGRVDENFGPRAWTWVGKMGGEEDGGMAGGD